MKTIQKLEIGAGIATPISISLYICFLFYYFGFERLLNNPVRGNKPDLVVIIFFIGWLLSLLVGFGAYYNAARQSKLGGIAVCLGAVFIIITLVPLSFFVLINSGVLAGLLVITPAIFALVTLCLAIKLTP